MTDATNNPTDDQSKDPKDLDGLQKQAREETFKAERERDTQPDDRNPTQHTFKPGAPGVPPVGNPD